MVETRCRSEKRWKRQGLGFRWGLGEDGARESRPGGAPGAKSEASLSLVLGERVGFGGCLVEQVDKGEVPRKLVSALQGAVK